MPGAPTNICYTNRMSSEILDLVDENDIGADGIDTVFAAISFSLRGSQVLGDIENLVLRDGAVWGVGNSLSNTIHGNLAANTLTGGAGQP